mmetsp:Transcript_32290/g.76122  ORF Transcript_32290/g.76122 Transcript_32290/m.76122 type:complete len:211 (-) Transcript_32290:459-1091(-)
MSSLWLLRRIWRSLSSLRSAAISSSISWRTTASLAITSWSSLTCSVLLCIARSTSADISALMPIPRSLRALACWRSTEGLLSDWAARDLSASISALASCSSSSFRSEACLRRSTRFSASSASFLNASPWVLVVCSACASSRAALSCLFCSLASRNRFVMSLSADSVAWSSAAWCGVIVAPCRSSWSWSSRMRLFRCSRFSFAMRRTEVDD